ncbi:MAG: hypothetical protein OEZ36_07655 [Spirochaetota bacterium]|nr:hypothetical protein [Spirochaetota bacterium]
MPYQAGKKLTRKDLEPYTEMELALMRVKLYDQNGYDFEKLWKREYNKGKYGYVIKPDYRAMELKPLDQTNDILIVSELERKRKENKAYRYLAFNASHVTKEISWSSHSQKFFSSVTDVKPLPFKDEGIAPGVVKPKMDGEISKENWQNLLTGAMTLIDLGLQKSHRVLYLVQYYPNKNVKYVISHETFGARLSEQDARNFSLYDYNGILRRSIYIVGNQDVYERDYFYNKEGTIDCVVQKVLQNNQLARFAVFRLSK